LAGKRIVQIRIQQASWVRPIGSFKYFPSDKNIQSGSRLLEGVEMEIEFNPSQVNEFLTQMVTKENY
jgi:hypothetical protein